MNAIKSPNVDEVRLPQIREDSLQRSDVDMTQLDTSRSDFVQRVVRVYGKAPGLLDTRPICELRRAPVGRSTDLNETLQLFSDFPCQLRTRNPPRFLLQVYNPYLIDRLIRSFVQEAWCSPARTTHRNPATIRRNGIKFDLRMASGLNTSICRQIE